MTLKSKVDTENSKKEASLFLSSFQDLSVVILIMID